MDKAVAYTLLASIRQMIPRTMGEERHYLLWKASQVERAIRVLNVADMMTDGPIPGASEMEAAKMTSDIIALAKKKAANGPAV